MLLYSSDFRTCCTTRTVTPLAVLCVVSELAGSQQDLQGAGRGRERDPPAPPQVLLLGPERRLQRPGPAQSALCAGHTHY